MPNIESVFADGNLKDTMEKRWEEFLVAAKFGATDLVVDVGEELSINLFQSIDVTRVKEHRKYC